MVKEGHCCITKPVVRVHDSHPFIYFLEGVKFADVRFDHIIAKRTSCGQNVIGHTFPMRWVKIALNKKWAQDLSVSASYHT